jgi:hypothetical protein
VDGEQTNTEADKTTVTIHRDALLGLIDQSIAQPAPLAHTVSRDQLRSRAVTRNDVVTAQMRAQQEEVEPLDTDLSPSLSPYLVWMIALLLVVFIVAVRSV